MVGDTTRWGQTVSESVEDIIRRIVRKEIASVFNGLGCPDPFMHDAAAGRLVPPPEECSWSPITAAPDCDFNPGCPVHGKPSEQPEESCQCPRAYPLGTNHRVCPACLHGTHSSMQCAGAVDGSCVGCTHPRDQHGSDGCLAYDSGILLCQCERVNGA